MPEMPDCLYGLALTWIKSDSTLDLLAGWLLRKPFLKPPKLLAGSGLGFGALAILFSFDAVEFLVSTLFMVSLIKLGLISLRFGISSNAGTS